MSNNLVVADRPIPSEYWLHICEIDPATGLCKHCKPEPKRCVECHAICQEDEPHFCTVVDHGAEEYEAYMEKIADLMAQIVEQGSMIENLKRLNANQLKSIITYREKLALAEMQMSTMAENSLSLSKELQDKLEFARQRICELEKNVGRYTLLKEEVERLREEFEYHSGRPWWKKLLFG